MPRHFLNDADVQPLVQDLIALVLHEGSVNAAQSALTATLAPDKSEGWLYPNRLHSLLSAEPARAVNTDTLNVLRLAVSRLPADARDLDSARTEASDLRSQAQLAWEAAASSVPDKGNGHARLRAASATLNLPPAVTQWLIADELQMVESQLAGFPDSTMTSAGGPAEPDWSFQDAAYARCLAALQSDVNRKVGLVIPTGGGKTRLAIRIGLSMLTASERDDTIVLWVTHRAHLKLQAHRELQRALNQGTPELPEDAARLLVSRVQFCMLGDLRDQLEQHYSHLAVVIVDEAHHAAAQSYEPLFDYKPVRGLFLTATPNRTDLLPIGIDEVAYTITPRELFARNVIIAPTLETLDLFNFSWEDDSEVRNLADYLLGRAEDEFVKTLVAVSRVEDALRLHGALALVLEEGGSGSILSLDDIAYVYGGGSSTGDRPDDFLDSFAGRPRGIVVATAQLLGEGFDDPSINAVVVTYPTGSMVQLMQVAGRALRYAPEKEAAYIVQMRDSELAYHYEQRWLYQDISDELQPQLSDREYTSLSDLADQVEDLLAACNVNTTDAKAVRGALSEVDVGDTFPVLLSGFPYAGSQADFSKSASWHAVPVTRSSRDVFLRIFNDFSVRDTEINDFDDFLRNYVQPDTAADSAWKQFKDMMWGMRYAYLEISGQEYDGAQARPYDPAIGTTWLRYVSFRHRTALPPALEAFLSDAINRDDVVSEYLADFAMWSLAVKVRLPLAGSLVFLLDGLQAAWFADERDRLRAQFKATDQQSFGLLIDWRQSLRSVPVPLLVVDQFDTFLRADDLADLTLMLHT